MTAEIIQPTAAEIDAAILAALAATGDELVCWTTIRDHRVPGEFWRKTEALLRLHWNGLVTHMQIRGRPYISLGDAVDLEIAARARAEGRVREIRHL
ncbi:MAG: hypothetical protein ACLQBX_13785 [Candidatus Limnocylindrales bacterium]